MTISQSVAICNKDNNKSLDLFLGKGNLIPHIWYHRILRSNGKPDTVGISILSELSYLYRSSKANKREFQLSYSHFINKFNFTRDQVYEALTRLESTDLIARDERSIVINGRKHSNEQFITLNVENLATLCNTTEEKKSICLSQNIESPHWEISEGVSGNILIAPKEISEGTLGNIPIAPKEISSPTLYIAKDLKKDNSYSYSYSKSNCDEREKKQEVAKKLPPLIAGTNLYYDEKRSLKKFHPISEEDGKVLCKLSGRDFSLDYINDLLLKLSVKNPKHSFYSKEIFMCYMAKIMKGEMVSSEQTATAQISSAQTATDIIEAPVIDRTTPWGKIRAALCDYYGKTGYALDKAWFGKLVPLENTDSNKLVLKAPTNFICDYIEQHYLHTIEKLCSAQKYSFSLIV